MVLNGRYSLIEHRPMCTALVGFSVNTIYVSTSERSRMLTKVTGVTDDGVNFSIV